MSHHSIRIQILTVLSQTGEYKLPEDTLFTTLTKILDAAVTDPDFQAALKWLKDKAYIDFTVEELSEAKRWFITESGKAKIK
jgi:hypothetical protein